MIEDLRNSKVVLFGAGKNGRKILELLMDNGITPAYFVDNYEASKTVALNGNTFPVKEPKVLLNEEKQNLRIIITQGFPLSLKIESQVKSLGLDECLYTLDSKPDIEDKPNSSDISLNKHRQYEYTEYGFKELYTCIYRGIEAPQYAVPRITEEEVASLRDRYGVKCDWTSTIKDYQIAFLNEINEMFNLKDKKILEVGGSNIPREIIVNKMQVKNWVSVDIPTWVSEKHSNTIKFYDIASLSLQEAMNEDTYFVCQGLTDDITPQFFGQFDFVISRSCFEHMQNFSYALETIKNCLVDGGILYSKFSPPWSSQYGSHFIIPSPGLYHNNPRFIPPFSHFLYSKKNIYELLQSELGFHPKLEEWADTIKYGSVGELNHYFYEDYEYFLDNSTFSKKVMYPYLSSNIDSRLSEKLSGISTGYKRFDVNGIVMLAIK